MFSIETLAIMKRLCFSFVGSTIIPYSPDETLVGKRKKIIAKIPDIDIETNMIAINFELPNRITTRT